MPKDVEQPEAEEQPLHPALASAHGTGKIWVTDAGTWKSVAVA